MANNNHVLLKVGKRIKHFRKLKKWSQEELGEKLNFDGSYIGRIERGQINITILTLFKIIEELQIPFYTFFCEGF